MEEIFKKTNKPIIKISAKNNMGIDILYDKIIEMFNLGKIESNKKMVVTNDRHKALLIKAKNNIEKAINELNENIPIDICSVYIREGLQNLGEILGENISEEIINEIFKNFCLGK